MKPYISLLRVKFINGVQYKMAALGGIGTQIFWGLMLVFIYEAFYENANVVNTFSYKDLVSFIWLQQAFLSFVFLYDWDSELLDMIMTGGITYELCRPISIYKMWYVKLLSKRIAKGVLRFIPVVFIAFLMPSPYNLSLPKSFLSFILFIISLILGLFLVISLLMLIYISIFKTLSPIGSIGILGILGEFFSGSTVPIPLLPKWLQDVCMVLPFRWVSDLPFRVYSGNIDVKEAILSIFVQIIWIFVLVTVGSIIMQKVTRLTMVQGG